MIDLQSPNALAVINMIGLGILGALAAFGQWYGKRREMAPPTTKDVVVQGVAIADRVALENLAEKLRDATNIAREHREHDADMLYELKNIAKSLERTEGLLGRQLDVLRSR